MTIKKIAQLGNPVLRQPCAAVDAEEMGTPELNTLLEDLHDTLKHFQKTHGTGRGIAAPQIGVSKRVVCIDYSDIKIMMINPVITSHSEEMFRVWDSCFSYWGIVFEVSRFKTIEVCYLDAQGKTQTVTADGDLSELLQHELEHLDGAVAIDQLVPKGKLLTQGSYERFPV